MDRIFLIGYMGSGKTTIGKMLARKLNFEFLDMDHFIEAKYHKTVTQIFADFGQDKFREIEQECLHEVSDFENTVIATGGGAPCFFDNMDYMNSHGLTVYLNLTPEELAVRLEATDVGSRPLIAGKNSEELRKFISEALSQRIPFYIKAKSQIFCDTEEEMVRQVEEIYYSQANIIK